MLTIRFAAPSDVLLLKTMIHEFAEFEHLSVSITEEILARDGFGPEPRFRVLLAESDGQAAGYAFFFDYYSSFEGRMLFLEDLFVRAVSRERHWPSVVRAPRGNCPARWLSRRDVQRAGLEHSGNRFLPEAGG